MRLKVVWSRVRVTEFELKWEPENKLLTGAPATDKLISSISFILRGYDKPPAVHREFLCI